MADNNIIDLAKTIATLGLGTWIAIKYFKDIEPRNHKAVQDLKDAILEERKARQEEKESFIKTLNELKEVVFESNKRVEDAINSLHHEGIKSRGDLKESVDLLFNSFQKIAETILELKEKIAQLEKAMDNKRSWDIDTYCDMVKLMTTLACLEYRNFVCDKILANSLIKNYGIICADIGEHLISLIADLKRDVAKIPFRSRFFKKYFERFAGFEEILKTGAENILNIQTENYEKESLIRQVSNLVTRVINDTNSLIEKYREEFR